MKYMLTMALGLAIALCACSDSPLAEPDAAPNEVDSGLLVDDLSMPAEPTLDPSRLMGSEACGSCHQTHYAQWRGSSHAYAMVDPVYRALVKVRQDDFDGQQDKFCLQCHSPIGTRSGDIQPGFAFEDLQDITLEGVNCETCHKIEEVVRPFNAGMRLDLDGPIRGPISNPQTTGAHASEFAEVYDDSKLCASCHDVVEVDGLNLERPYAEWLESPAYQEDLNCQSCHMATYTGIAAEGGIERQIHEHFFIGVDLPMTDDFLDSPERREFLKDKIEDLLDGAATLELEAESVLPGQQVDLHVTLTNNITAHNIPTGSTFNRQVWLEVIATDGEGNLLYETGTLDDNGDLKNYWSDLAPFEDSDLIEFGSRFTDIAGMPTLFSWRAIEHHSNSISPLYDRTHTIFVPTDATTAGPIHVEARLRFRPFAPFLLRALDLAEYLDTVEVYDIDSQSLDVNLDAPP